MRRDLATEYLLCATTGREIPPPRRLPPTFRTVRKILHRDSPSMASMGYAAPKSGPKCPLPARSLEFCARFSMNRRLDNAESNRKNACSPFATSPFGRKVLDLDRSR